MSGKPAAWHAAKWRSREHYLVAVIEKARGRVARDSASIAEWERHLASTRSYAQKWERAAGRLDERPAAREGEG